MELDRLIQVKNQVSERIFRYAGFGHAILEGLSHYVGVGIGLKNGKIDGELCVRFYVRRKLPPALVPAAHFINGLLYGVPTDVVHLNTVVAYGSPPAAVNRVSLPGIGVAIAYGGIEEEVGTLAAVLHDSSNNRYALSANHVLARNRLLVNRPNFRIVDAGKRGPIGVPRTVIGREVSCVTLTSGALVDCAVVKALDPTRLKQRFRPELGPVTTNVAAPMFGRTVRKAGYTTGVTEGVLVDQFADIQLVFGDGLGLLRFTGACLVRDRRPEDQIGTFAGEGDSGGLVVQQNGASWDPVGMVVGGPRTDLDRNGAVEDHVAICPLGPALQGLNNAMGFPLSFTAPE
jgi:hypothetical protein